VPPLTNTPKHGNLLVRNENLILVSAMSACAKSQRNGDERLREEPTNEEA